MDCIELDHLTRTYYDAQGETFCALDHVSLAWSRATVLPSWEKAAAGKALWPG